MIRTYLDNPSIRETLGVDSPVGNFSSCSNAVGAAFSATLDILQPTQYYVASLLERDVKALIYVGSYDWICNWVGNEAFTRAMEWTGKGDFGKEALKDWHVDDKVAGKVRSSGGLTFATIHGAGHMVRNMPVLQRAGLITGQVPYDKPREALALVNRWLGEKEI